MILTLTKIYEQWKTEGGLRLSEAKKLADEVVKILNKNGFSGVMVAGSILRQKPIVGDIDMMAKGSLSSLKDIKEFEVKKGGSETTTFLYKGVQINLYRYEDEYKGSMLFYLTGPQGYCIAYRMKAKMKNWKLTQKGLFDESGKRIAGENEEDIYKLLGKNWKKPELRGK